MTAARVASPDARPVGRHGLDLALDKRTAAVPVKPVPWGRFEHILRTLNLE